MKRIRSLLLAVLLCGGMLACKSADTDAPPQTPIGMPNPVKEVASAAAFGRLALSIDAPEGAVNVRYGVISDEIAQISFERDGRKYIYRAANTTEDISGVYEPFDDEEQGVEIDGVDWNASIRIRTIRGGKGGALATWRYGKAQYSLYTGDAVTANTLSELASALAENVCPRAEAEVTTGETLAPLFDMRAIADDSVKAALYDYFRNVRHEAKWFDARAAEGIRICVYAVRDYGAGTLAVADFYVGGELAPDLCYIEDGAVRSATPGSDCWAINYTRMNGDTVVYGKSFAWNGAPMETTHATAVFSDGTAETVEMKGEQGGDQPGYLFINKNEVWLDTLTLYDGNTVVTDQDSGEFTMVELQNRFAEGAPLCRWTRFNPMLDASARERRFLDAASATIQVAFVAEEAAGLSRWYKDSFVALPDLWRTLNNGTPTTVASDAPVLLDGLNREDARALYWVELALDDGTAAGVHEAVRQEGTELDSRASGGGDAGLLWSTPGAPGHDGLYVLVLDYGECWYTALFNVERGNG